ncbi:MAG: rod shape-determining protein RodA [Alphaproteobacteria bacterium]|nr:rod shape-determining protein RodA [Alphaproteobacteria bacterium]
MKAWEVRRPGLGVGGLLLRIDWVLVILLALTTAVGFAMLYSAAGGNIRPWAGPHALRFGAGLMVMMAVALIDIRFWLRCAYPIYAASLLLIVGVEFLGEVGMGAQRWLKIGPLSVQPSEFMKIALVLALARHFHALDDSEANSVPRLLLALALIAVPALLVARQPDLGTAAMIGAGGVALLFLGGISWRLFALFGIAAGALVPAVWYGLKDYQRDRVLTFLDPGRDLAGAGYHGFQSKIGIGSGGEFGKGYLEGTQSHLGFLPESHTDFIFAVISEEFGLAGGLFVLALYLAIMGYGFAIGFMARNDFARLLAFGVTFTFFLFVFANVAMVAGLIPVVGVPLPFISYGGTAMLTLQIGFGLVLSAKVYRDVEMEEDASGRPAGPGSIAAMR